ncbi:MAG: hypothetical protein KJ900_04960 [Proteobacteria bacterium]|nr:hypothetical protein [Desulfocapsa sp.]MBU3943221.1 hypothetical protein [Pseudomonadota bacterium]MCG2743609.1 hypothetical protein [Desulfobacteraceae bacterium]MBU4030475.1 hypothetical protein [Pseudomonadota bacterium]MBU4042230.1 hypothetical protein [Pseudomonadota bacterium]
MGPAAAIPFTDQLGNWLLSIFSIEVWGVLASWFSGFATLAVVFLALGLQIWYERTRRPKLRLSYRKSDDDDNRYVALNGNRQPLSEVEEQAVEELWLRMNIVNDSRATARDVELRFIYSMKEGNKIKEDRPSWWFKVANLNTFSVPIPPKFKQPFDIAYVKNCDGVDDDLHFFLAIVPPDMKEWTVEKQRIESQKSNKLEVGVQYRLVFAVVSSNANATYYELKIKASDRVKHDIARNRLQGPDALRRRLEVIGPVVVDAP